MTSDIFWIIAYLITAIVAVVVFGLIYVRERRKSSGKY